MFLSRLTNQADQVVERFVFGVWDTFHVSVLPVLEWVLAVAIALVGYQLWTGTTSVKDLWPKSLRLVIVLALVAANSPLERALYELVTAVPEAAGSLLTQAIRPREVEQADPGAPGAPPAKKATPVSLTADLDELLGDTARASGRMVQNAGWHSVMAPWSVVWGAILMLVTAIFLGAVALVVMISKLAVGILLGLAPFAVMMLFFDSTRSLFEGWLRQLLGFALTPVFLFSLLGLMMSLISEFSDPIVRPGDEAAGLPAFAELGPYLAIMAAAIGLTTQVVSWSSGVAGAMALSVAKAIPGPGSVARTLQSGVRSAAQVPSTATKDPNGSVKLDSKGHVSEPRRVRQAVVTASAFVDGAVRHVAGVRPARRADSSWRPPAASAPPPPKPGAGQESSAGTAAPESNAGEHVAAAAAAGGSRARAQADAPEASPAQAFAASGSGQRMHAAGEAASAGSGAPRSAASARDAGPVSQASASSSSSARTAPPPRARGERKE